MHYPKIIYNPYYLNVNFYKLQRPLLPPTSQQVAAPKPVNHPAPLPIVDPPVIKPGEKPLAPKPTLKISRVSQGK